MIPFQPQTHNIAIGDRSFAIESRDTRCRCGRRSKECEMIAGICIPRCPVLEDACRRQP
jgi:hypothetical protein